jgi:hypothetical protein
LISFRAGERRKQDERKNEHGRVEHVVFHLECTPISTLARIQPCKIPSLTGGKQVEAVAHASRVDVEALEHELREFGTAWRTNLLVVWFCIRALDDIRKYNIVEDKEHTKMGIVEKIELSGFFAFAASIFCIVVFTIPV